eukprot:s487_g3.t1
MPSSLFQRLKKVQVQDESEGGKKFDQYSLSQLKEMKVAFGQVGRGSTFIHMWETNQPWVAWVVAHFEKSPQEEHAIFIHFVTLMIERLELSGEKVKVPVKPPLVDLLLEARLRRLEDAVGLEPITFPAEEQ